MTVLFRCPHRPFRHSPSIDRGHKALRRSERYEAPPETVWEQVAHEIPEHKASRYKDELGHYWRAEIVCPVCSDTIEVTTDQDPNGGE